VLKDDNEKDWIKIKAHCFKLSLICQCILSDKANDADAFSGAMKKLKAKIQPIKYYKDIT